MQPIGPIDKKVKKQKAKPKLVYTGTVAVKAKSVTMESEGTVELGLEYAKLEDEYLMGAVLELFYA